MEYFHPRRKSTSTVEQFFGQLMLLADGGVKLNCRHIGEILSRVMLTNAIRMVPVQKKGFLFLSKLGVHMKSYSVPEDDIEVVAVLKYPTLTLNRTVLTPVNSPFDMKKSKRKLNILSVGKEGTIGSSDGHARKYTKTF